MRTLLPFLAMFKYTAFRLLFGVVLMICGLAASVGLLTLSGWFLAAASLAGANILFNFFYPSAGVRGLAIGRTALRYFERVVTHDATFRVIARLRTAVFKRLIPLSPAVLARYRNSDLLNRLVADVDTLDNLYLRLVAPFISAAMVILFLFLGLSLIDGSLALFLALTLFALLFLIPLLFYQLGKRFGEQLVQERAHYRVRFLDWLQNQAELLLFNVEATQRQSLQHSEQQWQQWQAKEANLSGLAAALLLLGNGTILVAMLWLAGGTDFADQSYLRLANIALFTFSALASFEILMPLGAAFLRLGQVISSAERVNDIIQQQPLVLFDGQQSEFADNETLLAVENVTFTYPEANELATSQQSAVSAAVLQGIDWQVKAGEKIALLGKTGSGKSSLLQLLVRNYDPQQGKVRFAGQDLSCYSEAFLRQQFCFLSQRVYVFSATLRDNLQLANEQASEQQMLTVLYQVGLGHLSEQSEGLNLWLGDGGRPLSGGEQRRLGLARVLLNNSPIVLLDEPTEGLDRETERQILNLILAHCRDKTLIMVTHRLTALEKFDRLCVIDSGRLQEQGSYATLATDSHSLFYRFLNRLA
ncbi:heme ABC transporter ATP-binding protein/permease CydC [Testudinibacter aquarius]|uniref:Glutathione/L-cysteine transport system ATP-binding/permease protein CydC n=1 Tax=Testudinibacter aquarius TaxID=1524974 RepID=A0A4R3Y4G7_9PAST|nr:cysteine/glutathione ABC transporter ATP-binding protein/permease CydC [Testudinibacter aquarius]KAE9527982.1 cysteine/glutathione ABC transporter ATP-binding protein/permease CydC [Testudinibacter aquarius]TCV86587.1 ATP-binding cassette subfamily C protein CydC [Testudinibacter aquarius]TNG93532.1 cysteine/glutathione ABC transporter ATP-binding protein/permease CydC [Testudinibacter aquarius]